MSEPPRLLADLLVSLGVVDAAGAQQALDCAEERGLKLVDAITLLGLSRRDVLERAMHTALGLGGGAPPQRPPLGEVLIGLGHLTAEQLERALVRQRQTGRRLGELVVELGYCSFKQLYEALAVQQRMAAEPGATAAASAPPAQRPRVKVLMVDDSELACQVVAEGLGGHGYEVTWCTDPYEALGRIEAVAPDLVLTDLDMPGLDGEEVCRRLKAMGQGRSLPVIILTANDAESHRVSGLRAGADDYVNKSASMDELVARMESILRRTNETDRVRKLFARYTSDAVVQEILQRSGEIVLTGEKREVTVLFADLRDFTSLAETLEPEEVVQVLNAVLSCMADAVLTCGGTLDKFLGDGVMGVFGAPMASPDDALRAVQAAKMMMEGVRQLRENAKNRLPWSQLAVGVGINTGPVVAGTVGSSRRTEYTCIGDSVNVAARLCSHAGRDEILVGEATRDQAEQGGPFEGLEPLRVKGKARPVAVYRVKWTSEVRSEVHSGVPSQVPGRRETA